MTNKLLIRNRLRWRYGIMIGMASLLDAVICFATLGIIVGGFRQLASLKAAQWHQKWDDHIAHMEERCSSGLG